MLYSLTGFAVNKGGYMITGSLKERNGKWYIIIRFNGNGIKQTQKWINTGLTITGNKKKAEKVLKEKINEYTLAETTEAPAKEEKLLFCKFLTDYLETRKPNIDDITYSGYKFILNHICTYFEKSKLTLDALTPFHIQKYYTAKLKEMSSNSVLKHHTFIRSALSYACKMKLIAENVTDFVETPEKQKFIGSFYNQEEIGKLLEIIKGTPIETPVMFAIYYGLRRSEILGIKWSAIDFHNKTLTVRHKIVPVSDNGKYRLNKSDKLKNKSSYRSMPINDELHNFLLDLRKKQDENKKFAGNVYNNDYNEYVCVNELGNILLPNYVTKKFKDLLQDNDLRVIRLHDLRHSCASLLLHLGYNMKDIQLWLGHGDIGTTMNIYAHIETSRKTSMLDGIQNAVQKL